MIYIHITYCHLCENREPGKNPRKLGVWSGKVKIVKDFDEFPETLNKVFYEEHEDPDCVSHH